jgi:hypothetical protein
MVKTICAGGAGVNGEQVAPHFTVELSASAARFI